MFSSFVLNTLKNLGNPSKNIQWESVTKVKRSQVIFTGDDVNM